MKILYLKIGTFHSFNSILTIFPMNFHLYHKWRGGIFFMKIIFEAVSFSRKSQLNWLTWYGAVVELCGQVFMTNGFKELADKNFQFISFYFLHFYPMDFCLSVSMCFVKEELIFFITSSEKKAQNETNSLWIELI